MKWYPKDYQPLDKTRNLIFTVFAIGVIGFLIPATREYFKFLIPFALIFSIYIIATFHKSYKSKDYIAFGIIYLFGFFIEMIGTNTGLIFGGYHYGSTMGIKILGTPLLIGANWLFLSYCCTSIANHFTKHPIVTLFVAPSLLLMYDILVEQVAPKMDMWHWVDGAIPIKNYIAWWIIGFICTAVLIHFKINTRNKVALCVFLAQFLFFVALVLFL